MYCSAVVNFLPSISNDDAYHWENNPLQKNTELSVTLMIMAADWMDGYQVYYCCVVLVQGNIVELIIIMSFGWYCLVQWYNNQHYAVEITEE